MALRILALIIGFALLYIPILSVVVYSFNASRLVTVWAGFSTQWYGALFENRQLLQALALSLRIALVNAFIATALGTCAALLLARVRRGLLRHVVAAGTATMLVIPEVILGFALLLSFVTFGELIGWPGSRGALTVTLSHITFSTAFAAVIIRARLAMMDDTFEEAARDLGAGPWTVLRTVTLPLLAPALLAAWLLSFTLSFDDLVIASFTSGPGSSTLPMQIYASVRLGVSPQINALATLMIGAVAIGILIATWILQRRRHKNEARLPSPH